MTFYREYCQYNYRDRKRNTRAFVDQMLQQEKEKAALAEEAAQLYGIDPKSQDKPKK
jgi:hypothetical protein